MKRRSVILNSNITLKNIIPLFIIPVFIFLLNINFEITEGIFSQILVNILNFIKSLLGIYVCFFISIIMYKLKPFSLFKSISKYSFDIYLFSWFPQIFCRIIFYQVMNLNYSLVVFISILSGFLPVILSKFILRRFYIFRKFILGIN